MVAYIPRVRFYSSRLRLPSLLRMIGITLTLTLTKGGPIDIWAVSTPKARMP